MVPKRRFQKSAFDRVEWHRREQFHPTGPNQVWSMDFVADQSADGSRFRSLRVVNILGLTFF
jgi:transposase InsO family protein